MADYSGIKGFNIKSLASDPALPGVAGATWASGGALNTSKGSMSHAGTATAGLVFGGTQGPPSPTINPLDTTESYDGTSWTEVNDLQSGRYVAGGAGTATAALFIGGQTPTYVTSVEEYDGTSWTEVNNI